VDDLNIPVHFANGVIAERGDAGKEWLNELPNKIQEYCRRWRLTVEGEPWHGYIGLVLPVRKGEQSCVLKLTWVDDETRHEALALELWNGNGAVKLLDAEPTEGALLLERLDPARSLADMPIDDAAKISAELLKRLTIPAPSDLPHIKDHAQRQCADLSNDWETLGRPFPAHFIDIVKDAAQQVATTAENFLVNQDLHYENVLAGKREPWLVIDPKIISGDPEFAVAPLLWNRFDKNTSLNELSHRFDMIVQVAELNDHRTRCWSLLRLVDYWLWALYTGEPDRSA
jgi:streptomycin 6-kinase